MKIKNFLCEFEKFAPKNLALSFDNIGLLIGDLESEINGIYVSLDVNDDVIEKAKQLNLNTIISHHPVVFNALKQIVDSDVNGKKIIKLLKYGINVISYHTNLDATVGGMNEELVNILDFKYKDLEILEINKIDSRCGIGRILNLSSGLNIDYVVERVKTKLNIDNLRFIDSGNGLYFNKLCLINGSGNGIVKDCYDKGLDLIITVDVRYDTAFDAIEKGISILDIGHFNSENIIYKNVIRKFINKIVGIDFKIYYDELLCDVYKYL